MPQQTLLESAKAWDNARPSFPGEHWVVLGAGLLLMSRAGSSRSFVKRMLGRAVATALIGRAASGRDGFTRQIAGIVKPGR